MNKGGPIIVIEDDEDDKFLLESIFRKLNYPNEVIFFKSGYLAIRHINATNLKPFIILSDINMPTINGFQTREIVQSNKQVNIKCTPFLFFTTGAKPAEVKKAYSQSVQGFFIKPLDLSDLEDIIQTIIKYWTLCVPPSIEGS